jgi:hypothetical protein
MKRARTTVVRALALPRVAQHDYHLSPDKLASFYYYLPFLVEIISLVGYLFFRKKLKTRPLHSLKYV